MNMAPVGVPLTVGDRTLGWGTPRAVAADLLEEAGLAADAALLRADGTEIIDGGGYWGEWSGEYHAAHAFGRSRDGRWCAAVGRDRARGYGCEAIPAEVVVATHRVVGVMAVRRPGQFALVVAEPLPAPVVVSNTSGLAVRAEYDALGHVRVVTA